MATNGEKTLKGRRILIPPSRPESNPLLNILRRQGAEVMEFPRLTSTGPGDYGPMDKAIKDLGDFDWIIFSGSDCVKNFHERLERYRGAHEGLRKTKICAIGYGAVSALKKQAVHIDLIPAVHTAGEVVKGLGNVSGLKILLIRVEGAARSLPERLKELGAWITEVDGYRMIVYSDDEMIKETFGSGIDAVALPNPTSVRFLKEGALKSGVDLHKTLKNAVIAAVGPATAETAEQEGLEPGIISKGRIADLRDSLLEYYKDI